jgi:hypothetical protein
LYDNPVLNFYSLERFVEEEIMGDLLTPQRTERGWVIPMTPEMAREADVAEGSFLVIYLSQGGVSAEVLPPASDDVKESVRLSIEKFGDAFAEMERLGD